ncbi:hypothetical protein MGG_18030 [Pyricularia oryzae 70-15]|uniref:Uncharacterized protein n=1 Tax=Pyricularia oryzae (strain 70-15 / ATCC MYA-4617 / FGSC 8958) TaxID=242507 RepID=G4NJX0_PYRO7|nr:uncharacterized protein MGG_18030 [Pyricularia oryzae 70-15]EHA46499.1 hypothetical protein MGG_18030 [Pyricularia oryzae 70-15]
MVPDGMSKAFSALNLTSQGLDVFKMLLVDLTSRAQKKSNRSNPAPSTSSPLTVARITRLAIDNNHPPVPSSPHLLGTSSPWLQTTDSSAVWTQAPLDEEPSTAVRRILRAPEGTGSRQ